MPQISAQPIPSAWACQQVISTAASCRLQNSLDNLDAAEYFRQHFTNEHNLPLIIRQGLHDRADASRSAPSCSFVSAPPRMKFTHE